MSIYLYNVLCNAVFMGFLENKFCCKNVNSKLN